MRKNSSVRANYSGSFRFLSRRKSFFTEGKNIELTDFFPPRTLQYIAKMLQEVSEKLGNKIIQADLTLAK